MQIPLVHECRIVDPQPLFQSKINKDKQNRTVVPSRRYKGGVILESNPIQRGHDPYMPHTLSSLNCSSTKL